MISDRPERHTHSLARYNRYPSQLRSPSTTRSSPLVSKQDESDSTASKRRTDETNPPPTVLRSPARTPTHRSLSSFPFHEGKKRTSHQPSPGRRPPSLNCGWGSTLLISRCMSQNHGRTKLPCHHPTIPSPAPIFLTMRETIGRKGRSLGSKLVGPSTLFAP